MKKFPTITGLQLLQLITPGLGSQNDIAVELQTSPSTYSRLKLGQMRDVDKHLVKRAAVYFCTAPEVITRRIDVRCLAPLLLPSAALEHLCTDEGAC